MSQDHPQIAAGQAHVGIEEEHPGSGDDQRHDHRRQQQGGDEASVGHVVAGQADGGAGAQHGGEQGGEDADQEAVLDRQDPFRIVEYFPVPAQRIGFRLQGEHAFGKAEERLDVE
ncbi:hypothetical protein D3C72_2054060 [compost metagenome]